MKIFVSWSGNSMGVAKALCRALPRLFDDAVPWISTATPAGAVWLAEIERELAETEFGILCVTRANLKAQWLNYEAGALSRKVEGLRELMPVFLVDIDRPTTVHGPLEGFQHTLATEQGFLDMMKTVNSRKRGVRVSEDILAERVHDAWPAIQAEVDLVRANPSSDTEVEKDESQMLTEILDTVRALAVSIESPRASDLVSGPGTAEGISRKLLRHVDSLVEPGSMTWDRFDQIIGSLARRLDAEFPPDVMVGVHPEGGFVGFLLWLDSARRWPIIVAPNVDSPPLDEEMTALGARIAELCKGKAEPRGLIVDASIKSGRTLKRTLEVVENACRDRSIAVEWKTLCIMEHPLPRGVDIRLAVDFLGVEKPLQFPFEV